MLTLKETDQLCIKAHIGQYRRQRAMTVEDKIIFADKLEQLSEEDDYEVNTYVINHHRFQWIEGAEEWLIEEPYSSHPRAVATMMTSEYRKQLALLHDVIEDTDYMLTSCCMGGGQYIILPDKEQYEISAEMYSDLEALTKQPGQTYEQYIHAISISSEDVLAVKIGDMFHNMSTTDSEKQKAKYMKHIPVLLNSIQ